MNKLLETVIRKRSNKGKLSLERIKSMLSFLGNPQDKLKFVHIAGTNGKGSITTMLSNILVKSNYKVGKYISPYVDNFFERIQINNEYINECEVEEILQKLLVFIDNMEESPLSFEIITAIAIYYFYINKCDIVFLEVGLGGRFDATNCIENTLISIINLIDFDHMDMLGNTLEEIAFEKCGIIKQNKSTVVYPLQQENAYKMVKTMSEVRNNKLIEIDLNKLTNIKKEAFNYSFTYKNKFYVLGLNGKHQIYNTLVVIETVNELNNLGYTINYEMVFSAIKDTKFIGRLDVVNNNTTIIIDGAHNASGARALKDFIYENNKDKKIVMIIGMKEGKQCDAYFKELAGLAQNVVITEIQDSVINSVNITELQSIALKYNQNVQIELSHKTALDKAIGMCNKNDIIIITGSLYLVSEFYETLKENSNE